MPRHCPKCDSTRIRRGYTDPSIFLRLIGIYNFLCDHCNLEYRAWAVPGTVRRRGQHTKRGSRHSKLKREEKREENPVEKEKRESQNAAPVQKSEPPQPVAVAEYFSFARYYLKLLLTVSLGFHKTKHSLGLKYRWRNWRHWQKTGGV